MERNDKIEFYKKLFKLALPIILQQFIISSLNAVDIFMVGKLGDSAVASVGLANQMFFLLNFILFGVTSGAGVFISQFWGKKDLKGIYRVMGISLLSVIFFSVIFTVLAVFFPKAILSLYTSDKIVIESGAIYLRIVGIGYIFTGLTYCYSTALRCTEHVKLPVAVSFVALTANTILNYLLIFGHYGFPELGVAGAAYATMGARIFEAIALISITYIRKYDVAASIKNMFALRMMFVKKFYKTALPVLLSEIFWSLGITTYNAIYARIGTDSIAALNIAVTIEGLGFVLFIGISSAASVLIGGRIGESNYEKAKQYATRVLYIGIAGAFIMGLVMFFLRDFVLGFYSLSETAKVYSFNIMGVLSFSLWLKVSNLILFGGILRSGGDTKIAFIADVTAIWGFGVPLAAFCAFVLKLPIYNVILVVLMEEVVKFLFVFIRFRSGKWINNLTLDHH